MPRLYTIAAHGFPQRKKSASVTAQKFRTTPMPPPSDLRAEFRAGLLTALAPTLGVIPFALLLGALATDKGVSTAETALMSAWVFAGSAQFAALDTWSHPAPWLALGLLVLVVNLRHVFMSASVLRRMERFSLGQRLLALPLLADEIWAFSEARAARRPLTPAFFFGLALPFYLTWILSCAAGTLLGALLRDPRAYGFDFAFVAIFVFLILGFRKQSGFVATLVASAAAATLVHVVWPGPASIIAGTLAGICAAAAAHKEDAA